MRMKLQTQTKPRHQLSRVIQLPYFTRRKCVQPLIFKNLLLNKSELNDG